MSQKAAFRLFHSLQPQGKDILKIHRKPELFRLLKITPSDTVCNAESRQKLLRRSDLASETENCVTESQKHLQVHLKTDTQRIECYQRSARTAL